MKIERFDELIDGKIIEDFIEFMMNKYEDDLPNFGSTDYKIENKEFQVYINFPVIDEAEFIKIEDILDFLRKNVDQKTTLYLKPYHFIDEPKRYDMVRCAFVIDDIHNIDVFMSTNKYNL